MGKGRYVGKREGCGWPLDSCCWVKRLAASRTYTECKGQGAREGGLAKGREVRHPAEGAKIKMVASLLPPAKRHGGWLLC